MYRPLGVTLLGAAAIVVGILGVAVCSFLAFVGLMGLCGGAFTTTGSGGASASAAGLIGFGLSLICLFAALALIVVGIGILGLRAWAWISAVGLFALMVLGAAVALIGQAFASAAHPGTVFWSAVALVLASTTLAYLLTPGVRSDFGLTVDPRPALHMRHAA